MNLEHMRAFLWLRWRLFLHQMQRGGELNAVLNVFMVIGASFLGVNLLIGSFLVGLFAFDEARPDVFMYVWDGIVVVFVFVWLIGLLTELQRSEALSLDKFLHLPVSVAGVFLLNYLSSLLSINLIVFVPLTVGLTLGLVFGKGPAMLLLLPMLAGFFLMVTALSYQFQGWLASLMADKRRRRAVIVMVTLLIVLVFQSPTLIGMFIARESRHGEAWAKNMTREQAEQTISLANLALPIGWLPLGAKGLAEGNVVPALLGTLGLSLIGAASLWRGYRTAVRIYTGDFSAGKNQTLPGPARLPKIEKPSVELLERTIPWVSESAAAIAFAGFRSLVRAPEAKLLLLTPIIVVVVFAAIYMNGTAEVPIAVRPLLAFGSLTLILFTLSQLVGNQFGFDRTGFRAFVLSPVSRREILLGKNLAIAPLALTMGVLALAVGQGLFPVRVDRFLALLPQLLSMYLVFCALANWLSIFSPMHMPTGAMKPTNAKLIPLLCNMLFIMSLSPSLLLTMLPHGIELILELLGVVGLPIGLLLSVLECTAVVWVYRKMLTWQGRVLQAREQRILEIVTTRAE